LREVFADPLFRDSGMTVQDMQEVASASPVAAEGIASLYRAYQQAVANTALLAERLADRDLLDGGQAVSAPLEVVRDFINSRNNHFPVLDETAEELYRKASLGADEPYVSLRNY